MNKQKKRRRNRQQVPAAKVSTKFPWWTTIRWLLAVLLVGILLWLLILPKSDQVAAGVPPQGPLNDYVTAQACLECHPDQHASWHKTFHRTMTQVASPETILAPFDDVQLESRDRPVHFSQTADGRYWCELVDPAWDIAQAYGIGDSAEKPPRVKREIVMATGSHHYQTYWVNSGLGNQLFQVPWVYFLNDQRWLPAEDAFIAPSDGPRKIATWNSTCIQCHAVAGQPGLNTETGNIESRVADFGIACEACHGPGSEHIKFHRSNDVTTLVDGQPDATIVNPENLPHDRSSEVCGQCHGSFVNLNDQLVEGTKYRPGDDLSLYRHYFHYDEPNVYEDDYKKAGYWPDGTMRLAGREYSALDDSACYLQGEISCLSCHSMHEFDQRDDQLIHGPSDDESCLQCHESLRDQLNQHTHHPVDSSGSRCYNCHMPHTSFGLLKAIRSHRIDSPSAHTTQETGRPNACNLCHLDQSLSWTAERLSKWYAHEPLTIDPPAKPVSLGIEQLLSGDAAQRAVAAWSFGWSEAKQASGVDWQVPFLARLLEDPYAGIRYVAHRSLMTYPGFEDFAFDFLGSPEQRRAAREQVVVEWLGSQQPTKDWQGNSVLVNDDGSLQTEAIEELISQRDNTPIYLPE